jgi:lysophospholipase L1-like esterase
VNILIFGSSITWGAWDSEGGWAQRIKKYADDKAASQYYNSYTAVYCLGVSGDNSSGLLKRFETEIKARLDDQEKTLILVEIGINDSQYVLADKKHQVSKDHYIQNIIKLIDQAKNLEASIVFVGLTPVDDTKVDPIPWKPSCSYRLKPVQEYEKILKNVCENQKIPFIEVMNKFIDSNYKDLLVDGLHPNSNGHKVIFEEVKKCLRNLKYL